MASPALRIRVRCPTVSPAPVQLEGCTPQTKFGEFKARVMEALGMDESQQQGLSILSGFPPRPLEMPQDAEIGGKLSDNENVTVRLATQTTGIQQGGKWGRSKRPKATASTASSSTRSSSRATKPSSSAADVAGPAGGSGSSGPAGAPAAGKKPNGKGKKTGEKKNATSKSGGGGGAAAGRTAAGSGASAEGASSVRFGGVHTLGGPLTPPAASPRGRTGTGGGGGSGGSTGRLGASAGARGGGGGSPPGQVRTLFGSSASTVGRAVGSSGAGGAAAAAAAARRAGLASRPGGSSSSQSPPAPSAGGGGTDAAAANGEADSCETGAPSRKRARGGTGVQLKSEGDIAERLLTAVGGGGKGTADKFFRKAMKLAVDKQYDQSRADARVRAALGGWYTAEDSAVQRRLGDGESVALNISFSKGAGTKSQLTETVDRIPREQVAAVVRMIARDPESREMLKPHNFAGCSPRMFWSLVQHWGGDVPSALRLAAPDVDWAFLDTRDRKPSEKAVANAELEEAERREAEEERAEKARVKRKRERRKRRKEGAQTDSSEDEEEQPEAVVAAAAGGAETFSPREGAVSETAQAAAAAAAAADARRRAANAALARLTASQQPPAPASAEVVAAAAAGESGGAVPMTVVGSEGATDKDETGGMEEAEESDVEGLTEVAGEVGAGLLVAAGVRTLGQLADRDEEELAQKLAVLQDEQRQERRDDGDGAARAGGNEAAAAAAAAGGGGRFSTEQVSEWVMSARGEELYGIMEEILEEDEGVIEALEEVSVSTPRDLVRLAAFPDVLVGVVRERLGDERFAPLADRVTAGAVERWRRAGDRFLEQKPWLELWVTDG